jgi:type I restriction enzyme S subunit
MSAVQPGYKKTEIGTIPEDWSCRALGEFCVTYSGGTPTTSIRDYYGGNIPWITSSDLNQGNIESVSGRITPLGLENSSAKMVNPNSLLIALYGATAGTTAITRISGAINQAVLAIIPKSGSTTFIYQYLRLKKDWIIKTFTQGGQPNLSGEIVKSLIIPIPDESEQSFIAVALSEMDSLIRSLDQLITKKRDIQQATMQQLLTGQRRLPGFSGEWKVKRLGEIANIKTGSKNNQDKIEDGEYPFYVRSATVERINSYSHDCEAILVPGEGGIGSIFHYINGRFDVHQRVYAITNFSDDVSGKYVHLYMSTRFGAHAMQNSVKATVDSLRLPTFLVFEVLLPPTKEEQVAIAGVLTDMNTELATLEARRDKARQIKQGMMQELLTGRIRLL